MDRLKRLSDNPVLHAVVLAVWPLFTCGRGLSVADTLYALGNYAYFGKLRGTWEIATFLANLTGFALEKLPGGGTVLGMQIYTSIMVSCFLLILYLLLKDAFGKRRTFLGLFIADSFAWCPTVILYNWLSIILLSVGTALLVKGVNEEEEKRAGKLLLISGVLFGLNVVVRMPNVIHALLIAVLIFDEKKRRIRDFLLCLGGWCAGYLIPILMISLNYGFSSYTSMLGTYTTMRGGDAEDYKAGAMLADILSSYADALIFLLPLFAVTAFTVLVSRRLFGRGKGGQRFCYVLGFGGVILWIRYAWGRGMFDFKYYHYNAVYLWGVIFVITAAALAIYTLIAKGRGRLMKAWALAILLTIALTPIGSNNALYPVVDDLFLIGPFALTAGVNLVKERKTGHLKPAVTACLLSLTAMMLIQGSLFHLNFALQDGYWGEERDYFSSENKRAAGVSTTRENAGLIDDLTALIREHGFAGREGIFYGNIPGLSYLLDIKSALSTIWPSLDTYTLPEWDRDMEHASRVSPVVFISVSPSEDEKYKSLMHFMEKNKYGKIYEGHGVSVYAEESGR